MSWYSRYLQVYEKSFDEVAFAGIISEVRSNLKKLQSNHPLVTVSIIAYNEEKHLLACLWALSEMKTHYPIEIIGVNNDSKDRTADIYHAVDLPFYTELQHSCGHARLCGRIFTYLFILFDNLIVVVGNVCFDAIAEVFDLMIPSYFYFYTLIFYFH